MEPISPRESTLVRLLTKSTVGTLGETLLAARALAYILRFLDLAQYSLQVLHILG